ncbi:MAG: hypothetical protein AB8C84_01780 [Oligoflexales bacterium]
MNAEDFILKTMRKKLFDQLDDIEAAKSFMSQEQNTDFFCDILAVEAQLVQTLNDEEICKLSTLIQSLQPISDHKLRGNLFAIAKTCASLKLNRDDFCYKDQS